MKSNQSSSPAGRPGSCCSCARPCPVRNPPFRASSSRLRTLRKRGEEFEVPLSAVNAEEDPPSKLLQVVPHGPEEL
ncbi:hypothetical protein EYF80_060586 [Liparis tanakae]|uniref:Uncharacterized protein n=1 Tax=Liparis tanakae TaxID=230148 RepID=A0A4Z2EK75_9TELE|nr:hypothetical protein EYF80_060586 [Liparis tanakae]